MGRSGKGNPIREARRVKAHLIDQHNAAFEALLASQRVATPSRTVDATAYVSNRVLSSQGGTDDV